MRDYSMREYSMDNREWSPSQKVMRGSVSDIPYIPTLADMAKMMIGASNARPFGSGIKRKCRKCDVLLPSELLVRIGGNKDNCHCKTCAAPILAKRKKWGRE